MSSTKLRMVTDAEMEIHNLKRKLSGSLLYHSDSDESDQEFKQEQFAGLKEQ